MSKEAKVVMMNAPGLTELVAVYCWRGANGAMGAPKQLSKHLGSIAAARLEGLEGDAERLEGLEGDAERLDFVLERQAFIVHSMRSDERAYQLWTQDEDEEFHIISGEGRSFKSPREAIDAAIILQKEK